MRIETTGFDCDHSADLVPELAAIAGGPLAIAGAGRAAWNSVTGWSYNSGGLGSVDPDPNAGLGFVAGQLTDSGESDPLDTRAEL